MKSYRFTSGAQVGQQLAIYELFCLIDYYVHNDLWHQVLASLGHNLHVIAHLVPDGVHLHFQYGVH